jgi:hypothetical protein
MLPLLPDPVPPARFVPASVCPPFGGQRKTSPAPVNRLIVLQIIFKPRIPMKNRRNPFVRSLLTAIVVALTGQAVFTATFYHDHAGGAWGVNTSWSTADDATTQDPAGAPGAADDTVFNISTVNANQTLAFNNTTSSAKSILFRSTGTVTFRSQSGSVRTLNLAAGGLTVNSGAGAVTLENVVRSASSPPSNPGKPHDQTFRHSPCCSPL